MQCGVNKEGGLRVAGRPGWPPSSDQADTLAAIVSFPYPGVRYSFELAAMGPPRRRQGAAPRPPMRAPPVSRARSGGDPPGNNIVPP